MCSAFPLSPLITYSLLSYRYSRLSASAEEADTDEFHSTSIFAMDARPQARLRYILTLILSNIGISVMLMYLKILKQKMTVTELYISMSIIENLSIYFHFIYISASNNPIFPTQVKLFSPQLSRKANFMVCTLTGSLRWKTPSLLPSWYSTVRSSTSLHS